MGSRKKILVSGGTSYLTHLDDLVPISGFFHFEGQPRPLKVNDYPINLTGHSSGCSLSIGTSIDYVRYSFLEIWRNYRN